MGLFRRAGAEILRVLKQAADPAAVAGEVQFYSKDVAGVAQGFARAGDGTISQLTPPTKTGVFVWEAGMSWATVYAAVNDGKPWIILVQRDGAFRTITSLAGTNLWNLQFVALGQAYTGLGTVTIKTTPGFTLGLDLSGFARFQSTNIAWEFATGGTPIASVDPVACSIDGGQLGHSTGDCFVTDTFLCEIKNNARIIGTGGVALVRLTGSTSTIYVTSWGQIGNSSFRTTTGAKTLTINLDWTIREINGAAFGAGVTPIYPQNQMMAVSPDGTRWTLEVDNTGTLIIS